MTDQSKPSTSQSCEHDKGTIWRTETGNGGFGVCSKVVPCPFCKPTAVEPSVESMLRDRIKELEGRLVDQAVAICEISKVFASKLAELERKE